MTLIYESAGLYLTIRGKAIEGGTEGDVVNVINLQSKRTVSGVVVGRGQVTVSAPSPRLPAKSKRPHRPCSNRRRQSPGKISPAGSGCPLPSPRRQRPRACFSKS